MLPNTHLPNSLETVLLLITGHYKYRLYDTSLTHPSKQSHTFLFHFVYTQNRNQKQLLVCPAADERLTSLPRVPITYQHTWVPICLLLVFVRLFFCSWKRVKGQHRAFAYALVLYSCWLLLIYACSRGQPFHSPAFFSVDRSGSSATSNLDYNTTAEGQV